VGDATAQACRIGTGLWAGPSPAGRRRDRVLQDHARLAVPAEGAGGRGVQPQERPGRLQDLHPPGRRPRQPDREPGPLCGPGC